MQKLLGMAAAVCGSLMLLGGPALADSGIDTPTDGQIYLSGSTVNLSAHTDLDPAVIKWAVRTGNCATATSAGTVAGNVDGRNDPSSVSNGVFSASVSNLADGNYCFVFNVNNGAVRDLHNFSLAPAQTKEQCKDGGWEVSGFKNQGECVSSFQANSNAGK